MLNTKRIRYSQVTRCKPRAPTDLLGGPRQLDGGRGDTANNGRDVLLRDLIQQWPLGQVGSDLRDAQLV